MKYPKLSKTKCKYPDREECNYTEIMKRCEFMKYIRDGSGFSGLGGHWECVASEALEKIPLR